MARAGCKIDAYLLPSQIKKYFPLCHAYSQEVDVDTSGVWPFPSGTVRSSVEPYPPAVMGVVSVVHEESSLSQHPVLQYVAASVILSLSPSLSLSVCLSVSFLLLTHC